MVYYRERVVDLSSFVSFVSLNLFKRAFARGFGCVTVVLAWFIGL
jgi:hypothetical protein